jgi:hypothetical protein
MFIDKPLEQDGIVVHSFEDAVAIQKILIKNGNAVMITQEENLWIVNWVWCDSGYADRNDVIFINRAGYECDVWEWQRKHPEIKYEESESNE